MGCGHSGTTLLSGLMYFNGYKMLSPPTYTFECYYLNRLNEKILSEENIFFKRKNIQFYLDNLENYIKGKWVLKDPLLNFLIEDYDNLIKDDYKILVIYRNPGKVINHLYKALKTHISDKEDSEILEMAKKQWLYSNEKILQFINKTNGEYYIIDYDDLLTYKHIDKLELYLGHNVNMNFVNKKLNKSKELDIESDFIEMFNKLESEKNKILRTLKRGEMDSTSKIHTNAIQYFVKKYFVKVNRKIFFYINKKRPVYLRKPFK